MASRIRLPCFLLGLHPLHTLTLVTTISISFLPGISILVFPKSCNPIPFTKFSSRSLPIAVVQHGGLAFLLMYLVCLTVVGAPLLLLETTLGGIRLDFSTF